ncbi:MAG: Hpt domain-containing protein [Oscillatoriales cyanobacterium SM2_2_1]|nr:Hpt domain-containing protein [Oscillatoriales cyanobacterium SM2_2_1]
MVHIPIDLKSLRQISEGDINFELELLSVYLEDAKTHLAQLQAAHAAQNYVQLGQEAHYFKGSSSNIGAIPMQTLAAELEDLCLHPNPCQERIDTLARAILLELEAIGEFIAAYS